MFLLIVFSIWSLVLAHIVYRSQKLLALEGVWRFVFGFSVFALGFSYVPARMLLAGGTTDQFAPAILFPAVLVIGFAATLWTLVAVFDLFSIVSWVLTRNRIPDLKPATRRQLGLGLWYLAGFLTLIGLAQSYSTPGVTRLQITVPGGQAGRLVMISDAHLGVISFKDQWTRTLNVIRELDPDAILIPGDLLDDSSERALSQVKLLRELFPDKPVYVTIGNHDSYNGSRAFALLCERLGFRLLRQQVEEALPGLAVAGIDDGRMTSIQNSVAQVRKSMQGAVVLLSHRPTAVQFLKERPETLVLSGHTHGGQTLPMVFLVSLANGRFRSGLYPVGEAFLYVSNGSGVWGPPTRLLAPPEVVLIEVEPGEAFNVKSLD